MMTSSRSVTLELVLDKNEKQRHEVAEWLSDVQSTTPPFTATPGTGQWLIRSDTFTEWEIGEFQVLFCPGDGALSIAAGVSWCRKDDPDDNRPPLP